ncbi:hypothetical protein MOB40_20885 [Bacillus inaquosorum]|uniref:hypothetical protein n=1 Tax=Bacillus subtilis group TaxID=653685 RepID=UPI0022803AEC|nr:MULTISPECIES: hypothetical protein [Bacillus subtilis group]MCY7842943.1 hypothetical protein [Bacillus spizizenii]MCY7907306.1 hypothetical protein [Bacillus inaquosorum]MCY7936301.1 hypothetical protein [Bacillus spizizenii]MCY7949018.1 hypothetical protein [Bacillus atrophaeus]MCY9426166.1 hypothetical protein [Bacillus spizizenii]
MFKFFLVSAFIIPLVSFVLAVIASFGSIGVFIACALFYIMAVSFLLVCITGGKNSIGGF